MMSKMSKKLICLVSFVLVGLVLTSLAEGADPNLVGWWKLDEGSGTTAYDASGQGNDGTLIGDPQWVAGEIGGAIQLDGIDDYIECGNDASLNITDEITIAAWVRTNDCGNSQYNDYVVNGINSYLLRHQSSNEIIFAIKDAAGNWGIARFPVDSSFDGVWHHLAGTYDGSQVKLYIDGRFEVAVTLAGSIGATATMYNVNIGRNSAHAARFYNGLIDDVCIYNRALTQAEIQQAMKGREEGPAYDPSPENEATDVPRDVVLSWESGEFAAPTNGHKVYLGESFDDVNDATGGVAQTAASYAPSQLLDFGKTYYWRVDEVNAPPTSYVEFKGEVWSFTTEPIGYPIEDVNATASSSNSAEEGPENIINGSGLDPDDLHSDDSKAMWLSSFFDPNAAWIQYEFDKVYKLHQMWAWNYNSSVEPVVGFGIKEATVEYSVDGTNWAILGTTQEFARAPGSAGYAANTTIDFSGVAAKYVKINANSNWGGMVTQYGLSEVLFLYIPVRATEPNPESGATDMDVDNVTLSWRAGREAAEHDVYISTDEQSVIDSNVPVSIVTEAQDGPLSLDLAQTYYWKVNEVNMVEIPMMLEGDIWDFATQDSLTVENFEDYNDIPAGEEGSNLVYLTWIDGFENPSANGSTIGYVEAFQPTMETDIVHGGKQSMPFSYDNSIASYSEATANVADLQVGQDWTLHGVKTLSLWFYGDPCNVAEQMYVKLNGVKVLYDGDAVNINKAMWQPWNIYLADFAGVNLSNITELGIGFERGAGASGKVLFDDIRLYPYSRELITPVEPSSAGLMAHYEFEGNTNDSSGNGNHGTLNGGLQWVAGKIGGALEFDGSSGYVEIPFSESLRVLNQGDLTLAAWFKPDEIRPTTKVVFQEGAVTGRGWLYVHSSNEIRSSLGGVATQSGVGIEAGIWYHTTVVVTEGGVTDTVQLYVNGVPASAPKRVPIEDCEGNYFIGCHKNLINFWYGLIDDVRIYDRALSYAEVAGLAGRTKPFDKPF